METTEVPLPATNADLDAWIAWVERWYPYRGNPPSDPLELRYLVHYRDPKLRASFARYWHSLQDKYAPRRPALARQIGFDGEDWER